MTKWDECNDTAHHSDRSSMAEALRALRGRFILSLNDHPDVRRIFAGFDFEAKDVRYSVDGMAASVLVGEVII